MEATVMHSRKCALPRFTQEYHLGMGEACLGFCLKYPPGDQGPALKPAGFFFLGLHVEHSSPT